MSFGIYQKGTDCCPVASGTVRIIIITARKRSLGQGNIFTPVCHSVHRGGKMPGPRGVPGGCLLPGGLLPGGRGACSGDGGEVPASRGWVCLLPGGLLLGVASSRGVPAPAGSAPGVVPAPGGLPAEDPPGWLLLRAVRILLECILVNLSLK